MHLTNTFHFLAWSHQLETVKPPARFLNWLLRSQPLPTPIWLRRMGRPKKLFPWGPSFWRKNNTVIPQKMLVFNISMLQNNHKKNMFPTSFTLAHRFFLNGGFFCWQKSATSWSRPSGCDRWNFCGFKTTQVKKSRYENCKQQFNCFFFFFFFLPCPFEKKNRWMGWLF